MPNASQLNSRQAAIATNMAAIIKLLSRKTGCSTEEAMECLNIGRRTFFRYLARLRKEGKTIAQVNGRHKLLS